jgi:heat shock protein HtpX
MRLDRAAELVDFAASPATEPLYPVDPFESEGVARMFKTHPPLDGRVRRLRELGAGSNGRVSGPSVSELAG